MSTSFLVPTIDGLGNIDEVSLQSLQEVYMKPTFGEHNPFTTFKTSVTVAYEEFKLERFGFYTNRNQFATVDAYVSVNFHGGDPKEYRTGTLNQFVRDNAAYLFTYGKRIPQPNQRGAKI